MCSARVRGTLRFFFFLPHCVCSIKEACIILCLSVGSAILLRNVLEEPEEEREAGDIMHPTLQSTLHELGVYCLAPCDVLMLLKLRVSWPSQ